MAKKLDFDYEDVIMGKNANGNEFGADPLFDVRIKRLVEVLPETKGKILDIGCGGGTISRALAELYPKAHVYGSDISVKAIKVAQQTKTKRVSFAVMGNNKFPYPDRTFDVCVCFDVLEHVPDPIGFLKETKRVLKNDGKVFFAIPCEGQPFSVTWFLEKLKIGHKLTNKHVGHIHPEFTHTYVQNLFEQAGFKVESYTFAEHFVTQCVRFIRFIIPKELLELFLGKRAESYYDRSIVTQGAENKKTDSLLLLRNAWITVGKFFDMVEHIDAKLWKHTGFAAWKILLFAKT